ncbi:hypothetical protein [Mesorhizobium sp. IMUNJ 23232]|uniref:hypothetical protein n=1 Tax=Mesorhizobium sp. IMUNJ 23232 TaxID=3376064 RepID=UPI0037B2F685
MPRRPKDPADLFSHNDLAVASGSTKRSVQMVADNGLLPGDGGIRDLKRGCAIGAFVSAGVPMLVAGRVTNKLLWALNQTDGEFPSRLVDFDNDLGPAAFPRDRGMSDYWRHRALLTRPDLYRPGEAFESDYRVEIAEREHVFTFGGVIEPDKWNYEGRIEGWARGSDVGFHSLAETTSEWRGADDQDRLNEATKSLRLNAVGILTVNLSLAIRNGLDRLAIFRGRKT